MSHLVLALATVLDYALTIYIWVVIISAVITWVNPDPYNTIVRFLRAMTEPVFLRVRRLLPFVVVGGFDLSPILVILAAEVLKVFVVGNLVDLALAMR
ncbi:MAG: YggT family protein [Desulfovibrionaceae bacterium]|nr:YggT family protein [Desulfovibrionaceae bacterium]MDD4951165.1 YggT family protein [Desulfovibrionaceae bacterium]